MNPFRYLASLTVTGGLLFAAVPLLADGNFGNMSPPYAFDQNNYYNVSGSGSINSFSALAESFTVGPQDLYLNTITVAVGTNGSQTAQQVFWVELLKDSGGVPNPGNASSHLEDFVDVTPNGILGSAYTPRTLNSSLHPLLQANTTYWVAALPGGASPSQTLDGWNLNSNGATGLAYFNTTDAKWETNATALSAAFEVTGASSLAGVPETSSLTMILIGGLFSAGVLYRSRRNLQKPVAPNTSGV